MKEKICFIRNRLTEETDVGSICNEKEVIKDLRSAIIALQGVNDRMPLNSINGLCNRVTASLEVLAINNMTVGIPAQASQAKWDAFYAETTKLVDSVVAKFHLIDDEDIVF